jgi:uncharacterized protein
MPNKWQIYDDLISLVPENSTIRACIAGLSWFAVSSSGTGLAMRPREEDGMIRYAGDMVGRPTREVAEWIKSWNSYEAALGLAAINSVLNEPATVESTCDISIAECPNEDVFQYLRENLRGKKVAVVGHFYGLEKLAPICELSILERKPVAGDFPDPACEYILADQDVVIITATTLINKTLPRLLELSRQACVVIAGPSTPLTPALAAHGIDMLGGLVVLEEQRVHEVIQQGGRHDIFASGTKMVKAHLAPVASASRL